MSRFTKALVVTPMADGKTWVIASDFGYEVGSEGSGDAVDVPVGFRTDFATIPRLFWAVLPRWGRYGNASVVHDWLYWEQRRPRREADGIFLEAMEVLEVGRLTRGLMFRAVRWFGWLAWHRNSADRDAGYHRVHGDPQLKAVALPERRCGYLRAAARAFRGQRRVRDRPLD